MTSNSKSLNKPFPKLVTTQDDSKICNLIFFGEPKLSPVAEAILASFCVYFTVEKDHPDQRMVRYIVDLQDDAFSWDSIRPHLIQLGRSWPNVNSSALEHLDQCQNLHGMVLCLRDGLGVPVSEQLASALEPYYGDPGSIIRAICVDPNSNLESVAFAITPYAHGMLDEGTDGTIVGYQSRHIDYEAVSHDEWVDWCDVGTALGIGDEAKAEHFFAEILERQFRTIRDPDIRAKYADKFLSENGRRLLVDPAPECASGLCFH